MKTVPNVLLSSQSKGELRVFDQFCNVDIGSEWQVYHSLNCSEHEYKRWAEIDFLLIGPDGLFVLEVKNGGVHFDSASGIWTYSDGENEYTSREGPFKQAMSAMYALKKMLSKKYELTESILNRSNFGWGVIFPTADWKLDTVEMPLEVVADRSALASTQIFEKYLARLKQYWLDKENKPGTLSKPDLDAIKVRLRPDVDVYPPFGVGLGHVLDQMQKLTEEQYERLEIIEANDPVLISGGAGTGKTFLMAQCARRETALGKRCLIVTESRILAAHLKHILENENFIVSAFQDLRKSLGKFDLLLVDEGQDLLDLDVFTILTDYLKKGLENGRWRWFMDENNQANISGKYDLEALRYLREGLGGDKPVRLPLVRNIRTTRQIAEKINRWTLSDIGKSELTGHGSPPVVVTVNDEDHLIEKVASVIDNMIDDDVGLQNLGIVYPDTVTRKVLEKMPKNIRRKLVALDTRTVNMDLKASIVHATASDFKGLERPVLLAIGFEGEAFAETLQNVLYTALTRCNYGLYLFLDDKLMGALSKNEVQARTEGKSR